MNPSDIHIIQIEPTSYCNAQCPQCGRFNDLGELHPELELSHLPFDAIKNLQAEQLTAVSEVILEGDKGDPIMHPQIEQFIKFFYDLPTHPVVYLMTNGGLRNQEWWYNLGNKFPNLKVLFSIDGLEDTNHLYRVGVNYKKVINNAQAFINGGGYAIWKLLIFKHNEHQVDQIYTLSKQLGFSSLYYGPADRYRFNGHNQWPVKINGQVAHYIEPASRHISDVKKHIMYKEYKNVRKKYPIVNRICPNTSAGQIYINHQGYVVPCCMMHFDTENNYFGRDQLIKLTEDLDNQSLLTNTLSTVLSNKFFNNNLTDSLNDSEEHWHFNCQRSCKTQIIQNKR